MVLSIAVSGKQDFLVAAEDSRGDEMKWAPSSML